MTDSEKKGFWAKLWTRPNSKWLLGIPLGGFAALFLGAGGLLAMNFTLQETSTNQFCYTCHSHEAYIRPEYEASSHFVNSSGVKAACKDCHLPKIHPHWFEYVTTKIIVSKDIIPELMGKIDTAEKYEAYRPHGAEKVWRQYKADDSRYCKHCHQMDNMDFEAQGRRVARQHQTAAERGRTCIDCHYGIVHKLPEDATGILARIDEEMEAEKEDGE